MGFLHIVGTRGPIIKMCLRIREGNVGWAPMQLSRCYTIGAVVNLSRYSTKVEEKYCSHTDSFPPGRDATASAWSSGCRIRHAAQPWTGMKQ